MFANAQSEVSFHPPNWDMEASHAQNPLDIICAETTHSLKKNLRKHLLFHGFFLSLIALEAVVLASSLSFFMEISVVSIALSGLFLTLFCYVVFTIFLQTQSVAAFYALKETFFDKVCTLTNYLEGQAESHILMGSCFAKLAEHIEAKECELYQHALGLSFLKLLPEKACFLLHWKKIYQFKEIALEASVSENIKFVKCFATSFEAHSSLANSYVMLSNLHGKILLHSSEQSKLRDKYLLEVKEKFQKAASLAVEEFKILKDFEPNNPWIHEQLALSFHDLENPAEEISCYEIILKLKPKDIDTLFKLGTLYFKLGQNARGLQVFADLKKLNTNKAEALIKNYGSNAQATS